MCPNARIQSGHREWTEDGQLWVQYVSSTPATRLDVINLQEKLDQQLQQRQVRSRWGNCRVWPLAEAEADGVRSRLWLQARETGICPIREELYAQTFDELIRQVTINCAERGLLLLRVRDEMRMTIAAYQVRGRSGTVVRRVVAAMPRSGSFDSCSFDSCSTPVQTLYESAVAFGIRKALQTEQGKSEMESRITQLEGDVKDLERQVRTGP